VHAVAGRAHAVDHMFSRTDGYLFRRAGAAAHTHTREGRREMFKGVLRAVGGPVMDVHGSGEEAGVRMRLGARAHQAALGLACPD
jgi:hypothetical protein